MSILTAAVFALVASPQVFKLTRSVAGGWVASSEGTAKIGGLILHAIVFVLLMRLVLKLLKPKKSTYHRSNNWGGAYPSQGWGGVAKDADNILFPVDGKVEED